MSYFNNFNVLLSTPVNTQVNKHMQECRNIEKIARENNTFA